MTQFGDLTGAISIPSNGCEGIEICIGVLRQWNTLTHKASPRADFLRNLKAKREKSSFGLKEVLMQTETSGSKSKERGFKTSRGVVRQQKTNGSDEEP
jgi:hypothetical protein